MGRLIVRFALSVLLLLTASRLALCLWLNERVSAVGGWLPVMLGGLRIDLSSIALLVVIPALLWPWLGHRVLPTRITAITFRVLWMVVVLLEVATPTFLSEYDTRPNRLFVEYLVSPEEVGGMLFKGFVQTLVLAAVVLALAVYLSTRLFALSPPDRRMTLWRRPLASFAAVFVLALVARGTLDHRPINPSVVAFADDAMVNTLPLNSAYSVGHAVYRSRSERSSEAAYGRMAQDDMLQAVRQASGMEGPMMDPELPTLHAQAASVRRERPLNLVIIIQESLGAQFVASLGGRDLTPNIDRHSKTAWNFRQAYATGTRSARGLEAITTGFPPTPSEAVLKLSKSQSGFFTLAQLLGEKGYGSRFVYGGEAHFDNMRAFFLGNGFNEVVDLKRFESPQFVGTWGASDDDMYRQLDRLLRSDGERPMLTVAFTVSNHTPWELPPGRVQVKGAPGADDAIRYADLALGDYLDKARAAPYWKDTVFLVIADHDARASGQDLVPIRNFHIPAFILGADVQPRQDDRLVSQIDMAPTLLSLIGVDTIHPMTGADLTVRSPDRALMQYGDTFGYLSGKRLLVLEPERPARVFDVIDGGHLRAAADDPAFARKALAHALWPEWAYQKRTFRLPMRAADAAPERPPSPAR